MLQRKLRISSKSKKMLKKKIKKVKKGGGKNIKKFKKSQKNVKKKIKKIKKIKRVAETASGLLLYVRKSKRLHITDSRLNLQPFARKWKGVYNSLLVVPRHKNFMLRMRPVGIGFFKKRQWRHRLYRRKKTRYKPISFHQQAIWKLLRFGTTSSIGYLRPIRVSNFYKSPRYQSKVLGDISLKKKKKYFKN